MVPGLAKYVLPCSIEYGKPNFENPGTRNGIDFGDVSSGNRRIVKWKVECT